MCEYLIKFTEGEDMDQIKFIECEYLTLRDEIKQTKERLFKLAGIGLVAVPSAYSLANIYKIQALVLSLPILICTMVLLFLSESRAVMRCGMYIKEKLETFVPENSSTIIGWEHWLSEHKKGELDRRAVDKFLAIFFYLLFAFYYIASVQLAVITAKEQFGVVGMAVALGFYLGIGIIFIGFLIINFKHSTGT